MTFRYMVRFYYKKQHVDLSWSVFFICLLFIHCISDTGRIYQLMTERAVID